ncbi:cell division protein ZapD [Pseudomonadota bacterium]
MNESPATAMRNTYKEQSTKAAPRRLNITLHDQVHYEQPLNERIRTLLRLEFLFEQAHVHTYRHSAWDSRAALNTLFDITNIFGRADLKNEIMKELERQTAQLERLTENPHVDKPRLEEILDQMDILIDRLHSVKAQDLDIRNNEFLSGIRQRANIAGGCCDFDLPAFHYWLALPEEKRVLDIQQWLEPFDPIRQAVQLILRLIRDSAQTTDEISEGGFFQKSLDTNIACQMIRVTLAGDTPYFAEISGGKHRFTIRFMEPSYNERAVQTANDVKFKLACCML